MGFKYYEQNQLMIPMEWKTLIDKDDVVFVLNDLIDNMNIDKLLETYSPLGSSSYDPKMMLKILMYGYRNITLINSTHSIQTRKTN